MRLATSISRISMSLIVLVAVTSCAAKGKNQGMYAWMNSVGLKDQKYAAACGPAEKYGGVAPDVRAGSKPRPAETFTANRLSDIPTDKFWYEGVQGVAMQPMRAEPRAALCPYGGKVEMRRPSPAEDEKFNKECCPSGLWFASPRSGTIEGVPTSPGSYTTNVVLCGRCDSSTIQEYPLVFTIDWVIEGHAPKRLD